MINFTLFLNSFLSYLLVFIVMAAIVIAAVFIGITMRKHTDAKMDDEVNALENNKQ